MEKLQELTLSFHSSYDKQHTGTMNVADASGNVLRSLNEFKIRKTCGEVMFRAGMQIFTRHGVSDRKFAENTLSGRIEAGAKESKSEGIPFFRSSVTLERKNSRTVRTYGECQCVFVNEGNLCPHLAALMIAWIREPREFREDPDYLIFRFEKAKQEVRVSLEELLNSLKEGTGAYVLDLLQKTYSKIKYWGNAISDKSNDDYNFEKNFDPIREFSRIVNDVSLMMMSAIGRKYDLQTLDVYNSGTVTTFGKMLDLFVEKSRYNGKLEISRAEKKERKLSMRINDSKGTTRSWDLLVENFTKGN